MPHPPDFLFYNIALTQIPEIGSVTCKNLIAYCGNAKKVFSTPESKLRKVPLVGEYRARKIIEAAATKEVFTVAEHELDFIEKHKIEVLFYTDDKYPKRLLHCEDAPILLYYKGNVNLNAPKILSVVGTRNATAYGKSVAQKIIEDLSASDVLILSGLAYGIDAIAHQAAIEHQLATVAVLGHGLNRIYPEKHKNLAKKILENGGLLTEYSSQCEFHPANFPERNKIVAGMSDAIVVIETDLQGGAIITANIANAYHREVFAVPGKVGDRYSKGCNYLIKTFKASMAESAEDILLAMNWQNGARKTIPPSKQLTLELNENEKKICSLLAENEKNVDVLLTELNLSSSELSAILLDMEMNGIIKSLPGKKYKLA
jgi:DNA processing protein